MRCLAVLFLLTTATLFGAEPAKEASGQEATQHEADDTNLTAKWVDFLILAGGLGYLVVRFGLPLLKAQQKDVVANLEEAARRASAAQAKAVEIDRHVASLGTAIQAVRDKAAAELAAEAARIEHETGLLLVKVQQGTALEIESAAKAARQELKTTGARLALELAVIKIRGRMNPEIQNSLVDRFTAHLDQAPGLRI